MVVDSPSHLGDDGRLLCRGGTSLIQEAGGRLKLITVSLMGTCGTTAAVGNTNGLSTGIGSAGVSALKFDSS